MAIFNMVGGGSSGGGGYKTYNQLKAMTLADAITELNTDAQGYYDNLNGNGHIIGIGIANNDKTTYQCWDVSPIIYWNGSWRNGEIIIVKIKTDSSGNLMIPKAGYGTGGSQSTGYNWRVSYDGGSETYYTGVSSAGSITIASGLTADTGHTVVIRPNSESYGWARAFGFRNSGVQTYLTEIVYDGSYRGYSSMSTLTDNCFRYYQYYGCTSLTTAPAEVLPNTVTSIGAYFRTYQYYGCTSLTTAPSEALPDTVTSIGNYFRRYQYQGTSLTSATSEVLPDTVTSIGTYFRSSQYQDCTNLTTASQEVLTNTVTTIGNYFRSSQYNGCINLIEPAPEVMSSSITTIGAYFRYQQYNGCTSIKSSAQEVLPNTVTTIGNYFRSSQYYGCTAITASASEVLPDTVTSIGTYFRYYQYRNCTSLTNIQGWKDLSIGNSNYRASMYDGCTSMKTVKVLGDVGYPAVSNAALLNNYVSVVLVPSAYLQNYIDATGQPRSRITNSKFVGY